MTVLLELKDISKSYQDINANNLLFHQVTATVSNRQRICCVGQSGQGKSSLLRIIARLDIPSRGQLLWNGTEASQCDVLQWRQQIHYVAQHAIMLPHTVQDNLQLPSLLHARPFQQEQANTYMKACGLSHINWDTPALNLSGGERQRLALIRGLLLEPKILLLDEITASLDEGNSLMVEHLLNNWILETNGAYIWISHDSEQVKRVSNEVWHFENHRVTTRREAVTL